MFYKDDCLAVDKDIALISRVLLDDGNRIIIPQQNFKFLQGVSRVQTGLRSCTKDAGKEGTGYGGLEGKHAQQVSTPTSAKPAEAKPAAPAAPPAAAAAPTAASPPPPPPAAPVPPSRYTSFTSLTLCMHNLTFWSNYSIAAIVTQKCNQPESQGKGYCQGCL